MNIKGGEIHQSEINYFQLGRQHYLGANYEKSMECLEKVTKQSEVPKAHYILGIQYLRGCDINLKKALYFLRSSNSKESNHLLGNLYFDGFTANNGESIEKNDDLALKHYLLADNVLSYFRSGVILHRKKKYEECLENFLKCAELGDSQAMNVVANLYRYGLGNIPKNIEKSIEFYKESYSSGYSRSGVGLGKVFHYEKKYVDYKKALEWYLKSGHEDGYFGAGIIYYYDGKHLNLKEYENQYKIAMEFFEKAANSGHVSSHSMLGWMNNPFNTKVWGIEKDKNKMLNSYKFASSNGDRFSINHLACCYGKGVKQDPQLALKYHLEAAEKKCVDSYLHLGIMNEKGNLIQQNFEESKKWFLKVDEEATLSELLKISDDFQFGDDDLDLDRKRSIYYLRKALEVHGKKDDNKEKIKKKYRKFYKNETHLNLKKNVNNNYVDCKLVVTFDNQNFSGKNVLGKRKRDEEIEKRKRLKKE